MLIFFMMTLVGFSQKDSNQTTRPNIVFIFSDDHATNAISAYGGIFKDIAPTPNIDRIANEGALLKNALCTNAICGPSRAAILTGKYSHVNGYFKNYKGGVFNNQQWTYPQSLQASGYQTALIGKWHLVSEPIGFDYYKYHISKGEQGLYWDPVYNDNGKKIKEKGYATNLTTDFAMDWLNERNPNQPFCLMLQYKAPHRQWAPDTKYEDLWENQEMPTPSNFNDTYQDRELTAGNTEMTMDYFSRRDMKMTPPDSLLKKARNKWLQYGFKPGEVVTPVKGLNREETRQWKYQKYIKDYLATIRSVDDNIGRVLEYLKVNGLEENTIVIYASDQGFFLGEHGFFDKRFMYEEALHMPFIIRYPGKIKPRTVVNDIITNIDFAPTLLEMAGVSVPEAVQGKSFFNNLKGKTSKDWRQSMYYHYYEYPFYHRVQPHYGIRNQRYKLIHFYYDVDIWEFYDLQNDSSEINNLINSETHTEIIDSLKTELYRLKEEYGNTMSLSELRNISDTDFGGLESNKK
ncbi:sulfatase [uncultured Polaribacter sp.]|uniref:sulfatase family protein n=1 Tax=uncultured Polaribacter sp. TaxID=174711 RepID=UPI002612AD93|nr:sulfatase [uncultured Polaribacter sp.]